MTASPTVECVEVLQSKAYVCEDDLIEEFQANADWELHFYKVRCSSTAQNRFFLALPFVQANKRTRVGYFSAQ